MANRYKKIHPDFKLQGENYTKSQLKEVAYSLVKEGADFEKSIGDFLIDWLSDADQVTAQTSGSTGTPKQILLQKQLMVNSALATGSFFGMDAATKALLSLPATYIAGKMMLVRAIVLGWHLDYMEPTTTLTFTGNQQYDFGAMVPLQVKNSINDLYRFKTLIVGGAPVSLQLKQELRVKRVECEVFETYGMTETITHIALRKVHPQLSKNNSFKALPDVCFAEDDRGCLLIKAPKVSISKIVTNDLVRLHSETEFEWLGRFDNVINSGGVKLFPEQIESKLSSIIESRFFVAGISDVDLGQKLVLLIEDGHGDDNLKIKIQEFDLLERYERPKDIFFISEFQLTKSGKINRNETLATLKSLK